MRRIGRGVECNTARECIYFIILWKNIRIAWPAATDVAAYRVTDFWRPLWNCRYAIDVQHQIRYYKRIVICIYYYNIQITVATSTHRLQYCLAALRTTLSLAHTTLNCCSTEVIEYVFARSTVKRKALRQKVKIKGKKRI